MRPSRWRLALCVAIAVQVCVVGLYALTLHATFKTSAYDIGAYTQAFYNLLGGQGLTVTISGGAEQSWFGKHFSPILYVLAPVYTLWPMAETLRLANVLLLALAALPLYSVVLRITGHAALAFTMAVAYLVNPFVVNAAVWDFHEVAFAPFLFACTYLALLKKQRGWFMFFCVLLLSVKEQYGVALAGFGLLWGWHHKEYRFGVLVAALGLAAFFVIVSTVIPHFNGGKYMAGGGDNRFAWLMHPLSRPDRIVSMALGGFFYVMFLALAGFLTALSAWQWLSPGIADLAANIASANVMMRTSDSYYSSALIVVFAVATAQTLARAMKNNPKFLPRDAIIALSTMAIFLCHFSNLPYGKNRWELGHIQPAPAATDAHAMNDIRSLIPASDAVAAQLNVGAHFSDRRAIYVFPDNMGDAAWLLLRLEFPFEKHKEVFNEPFDVPCAEYTDRVGKILADPAWVVAYWQKPWLVMHKGGNNVADRNAIAGSLAAMQEACTQAEKKELEDLRQ
jgi:uncharacterized membrane protein